jgi:hypothetical protein
MSKNKLFKLTSVLILMLLSMFLSLMIPSNAEEKPIIDILREENQVKSDDLIYDKSHHYKDLKNYDLTNALIFKVYPSSHVLASVNAFNKVLENPYSDNLGGASFDCDYYACVGDELLFIRVTKVNYGDIVHFCIAKKIPISEALWMQDILNSKIYNSELHIDDGENYQIIIFNGQDRPCTHYGGGSSDPAFTGIQVAYIKDSYTIVSNYKDYGRKLTETTLEEYRTYWDDWDVYLSELSEEERQKGGYMGINELIEFNNKANVPVPEPTETEQPSETPEKTPEQTPPKTVEETPIPKKTWFEAYGVYVVISIVLIVTAAVVVVILKKRKT